MQNTLLAVSVFVLLSSCDRSGHGECIELAIKSWQEQRTRDLIVVEKLVDLFQKDPNKYGSIIVDDPDYIQASQNAKIEIFRRLVAVNPNYIKANEATQTAIENRFGVERSQISSQMELESAAKSRIFKECKRLSSGN